MFSAVQYVKQMMIKKTPTQLTDAEINEKGKIDEQFTKCDFNL